MDPRDDSDDLPRDDSDDPDPMVRSLRAQLLRVEAQLDQILAGEREHGEEVTKMEGQMRELQGAMETIRARYRLRARVWGAVGLVYGIAIGLALAWLARSW